MQSAAIHLHNGNPSTTSINLHNPIMMLVQNMENEPDANSRSSHRKPDGKKTGMKVTETEACSQPLSDSIPTRNREVNQ